jgi:hypothetical protein
MNSEGLLNAYRRPAAGGLRKQAQVSLEVLARKRHK